MIRTTQRTLYYTDMELHRFLGKAYKPMVNTTLNEKFNVEPTSSPDDIWKYPTVNSFAIGVGGDVVLENTPNYAFSEHNPTDACLFHHVPFRMRETKEDLTNEEKEAYRLRKVEVHDNKEYACYYLKKITGIQVKQIFFSISTLTEKDTGLQTPILTPLDVEAMDVLNPQPSLRQLNYKNMDSFEYVTVMDKISLTLTTEDQQYIEEACNILNLPNRYLTEMGIVMGIDQLTPDGYNEILYAQISHHLGVNIGFVQELRRKTAVTKYVELGGIEPYPQGIPSVPTK